LSSVDLNEKHRYPCSTCTARCHTEADLQNHVIGFGHETSIGGVVQGGIVDWRTQTHISADYLTVGNTVGERSEAKRDEGTSNHENEESFQGSTAKNMVFLPYLQEEFSPIGWCSLCDIRSIRTQDEHNADILHQTNLKLLAEGLSRIGLFFHCTICGQSLPKGKIDRHFDGKIHNANIERGITHSAVKLISN